VFLFTPQVIDRLKPSFGGVHAHEPSLQQPYVKPQPKLSPSVYQLLLRAGFIRQLAAGIFSYLRWRGAQ
jgi:hypothetical protein